MSTFAEDARVFVKEQKPKISEEACKLADDSWLQYKNFRRRVAGKVTRSCKKIDDLFNATNVRTWDTLQETVDRCPMES